MEERSGSYYSNPINKSFIILGFIAAVVLWIFSIFYYAYWPERVAIVILEILGGCFLFLYICSIEYLDRPFSVFIGDEYFVMYRRYRKEKKVPLDRITETYFQIRAKDTFLGRFSTDGAIYLLKPSFPPIKASPEIVKAVRERFFKLMGRYPDKYPGSD